MGLLDDTTHQQYYQGNDYGDYQFISLDDIITQFQIAYVGEDKVISKVKRVDIAFHAQRALQELSFDTFKSTKAQEIVLPPSLQMLLPHDYINYTKISTVDSAGIKHLLYPTSKTSNPFSILQDSDGNYNFPGNVQLATNADFEDPLTAPWFFSTIGANTVTGSDDSIAISSGALTFTHYVKNNYGNPMSRVYATWQAIDVTDITKLEISAAGTSAAASGTALAGTLRFGISSTPGSNDSIAQPESAGTSTNVNVPDIAYVEWNDGTSSTKDLLDTDGEAIDVSAYNTVYILITSFVDFSSAQNDASINSIDDISVIDVSASSPLTQKNNTGHSETWKSYKSKIPSENQDDYQDDTYWPMD